MWLRPDRCVRRIKQIGLNTRQDKQKGRGVNPRPDREVEENKKATGFFVHRGL
jgi:hypothetical protein